MKSLEQLRVREGELKDNRKEASTRKELAERDFHHASMRLSAAKAWLEEITVEQRTVAREIFDRTREVTELHSALTEGQVRYRQKGKGRKGAVKGKEKRSLAMLAVEDMDVKVLEKILEQKRLEETGGEQVRRTAAGGRD